VDNLTLFSRKYVYFFRYCLILTDDLVMLCQMTCASHFFHRLPHLFLMWWLQVHLHSQLHQSLKIILTQFLQKVSWSMRQSQHKRNMHIYVATVMQDLQIIWFLIAVSLTISILLHAWLLIGGSMSLASLFDMLPLSLVGCLIPSKFGLSLQKPTLRTQDLFVVHPCSTLPLKENDVIFHCWWKKVANLLKWQHYVQGIWDHVWIARTQNQLIFVTSPTVECGSLRCFGFTCDHSCHTAFVNHCQVFSPPWEMEIESASLWMLELVSMMS
jgi:hypothetical protein